MDKKNPNNHNPEGHNQYTKKDGKSSSTQQTSGQAKKEGQKAPAHNPDGHNQYTKK